MHADLETFKQERVNASSIGLFSTFLSEKSKCDNIALLKTFLQAILKKENFLSDYIHFTKMTQTSEFLTDFMKNYIEVLTTRLEDKDAFLLAECFFYAFLFLADKCRLSEYIFLNVLADFVESFGFRLAENLLELAINKQLRKIEERLRFVFLFYSDDGQLKKLLEKKDSWSSFTLLYLFLSNPQSSRGRYLKHELLRESSTENEEASLKRREETMRQNGKVITPEILLIGLLEEDSNNATVKSSSEMSLIERSMKELLKRSGSKDLIESLFGIYQGLHEAKKNNPKALNFNFVRDTIKELYALIQSKTERNQAAQVNELKVIMGLFGNFLGEFPQDTMADNNLVEVTYSNLLDLIMMDNGFTKYIGISVFTNLLLKKIKKSFQSEGNAKDQSLKLVKVCLKGLEEEPEAGLFTVKNVQLWPQIYSAISRLIDENLGDERRRISRIQDYLKRVEEEFQASRTGNNDMNNEVWRFLKKLP